MNDEFYIGWADKAPVCIGGCVRRTAVFLLVLAVLLGVVLAIAQRTIGVSVFEWGKAKNLTGILRSQPYPHLLVPRPDADPRHTSRSVPRRPASFSNYHLVNPFKFGFDREMANRLDGTAVSLRGTLIYRGSQTMIEVVPGSLKPIKDAGRPLAIGPAPQVVRLGRQRLIGEIVDSKCYLGVMNPGALTPHRACAIRCISGGIPPVLLVRQSNGSALYFLLVSLEGRPVNKQVLHLVAEPVEISGDVERQGDLLILRADPETYQRVTSNR